MRRQFNMKIAMQSVGMSLIIAYVLAVLAFQLLRFIW